MRSENWIYFITYYHMLPHISTYYNILSHSYYIWSHYYQILSPILPHIITSLTQRVVMRRSTTTHSFHVLIIRPFKLWGKAIKHTKKHQPMRRFLNRVCNYVALHCVALFYICWLCIAAYCCALPCSSPSRSYPVRTIATSGHIPITRYLMYVHLLGDKIEYRCARCSLAKIE